MPKRPKPPIYSYREMVAMAQASEIAVFEERARLQREEAANLHKIRREVLDRLCDSARVTMSDCVEVDPENPHNIRVKDLTKLPPAVARTIKKLKFTNKIDGSQVVEVDLAQHLEYDATLSKYVGILNEQHLHLHQNEPASTGPLPAKLHELPPDRLKAERARLEKEVEEFSVRETKNEEAKP